MTCLFLATSFKQGLGQQGFIFLRQIIRFKGIDHVVDAGIFTLGQKKGQNNPADLGRSRHSDLFPLLD